MARLSYLLEVFLLFDLGAAFVNDGSFCSSWCPPWRWWTCFCCRCCCCHSAFCDVAVVTLCSWSVPKSQMLGSAANSKVGGSNIILQVGAMELALSSTSTPNAVLPLLHCHLHQRRKGKNTRDHHYKSPCQPFYRCWWKKSEARAYWWQAVDRGNGRQGCLWPRREEERRWGAIEMRWTGGFGKRARKSWVWLCIQCKAWVHW